MGAVMAKMHRTRHVKARCCGGEVNIIVPLSKALGTDLNFFQNSQRLLFITPRSEDR